MTKRVRAERLERSEVIEGVEARREVKEEKSGKEERRAVRLVMAKIGVVVVRRRRRRKQVSVVVGVIWEMAGLICAIPLGFLFQDVAERERASGVRRIGRDFDVEKENVLKMCFFRGGIRKVSVLEGAKLIFLRGQYIKFRSLRTSAPFLASLSFNANLLLSAQSYYLLFFSWHHCIRYGCFSIFFCSAFILCILGALLYI